MKYKDMKTMLHNIFLNLAVRKRVRIFALELKTMPRLIQVFTIAAFFISANSLSCCFSQDSRYIALSDVAMSENSSFFYFNNIFSSTMPRPTKQCSTGNNSTELNPAAGEKPARITVTLTGVKNNQFQYTLRKIIFEFIKELTCGYSFAELRFIEKFKAAMLLFPEGAKELFGKTVIIK